MTRPRRSKSSNRKPKNIEEVASRVERQIKSASELPTNSRFCFYGRGGQGKTRLAATAPNVLMVDVNDKGWDSIRRDLDPKVFPIEFWQEINDVYWYLQSGDHPFESVAIDSVTGLQNLCLKFVLGDEASRDASRDPDMPSRTVYGKVSELMKTQIINFRNLPMNVIFTARQRYRTIGGETEDEESEGQVIVQPNLSPAILDTLEQAVPLVGHLTAREVRTKSKKTGKIRRSKNRRLFVGESERYTTKERYGVFPNYIEAPNVADMIAQIYGEER